MVTPDGQTATVARLLLGCQTSGVGVEAGPGRGVGRPVGTEVVEGILVHRANTTVEVDVLVGPSETGRRPREGG